MASSLSRRRFLARAAATAAGTWVGANLPLLREALAATYATVRYPGGTTFASTIVPAGTGRYRRMTDGPGWPLVFRTLGPTQDTERGFRREPVATIVHLTDIHLIDSESPSRVEFLDRYADAPSPNTLSSAHRPQDVLTTHVAEAMVRRINEIGRGPVMGRPYDCAVSTGDNLDNQQENELEWMIALLAGGPVSPGSGGPVYEGVQDQDATTYDAHYWHPDDERPDGDDYKQQYGFPAYPGLLDAARRPFVASGLRCPWYSTYGNHDGLLSGNMPANAVFDAISTGPIKVVTLPAGLSPADVQRGLEQQDPGVLTALATAPGRAVTPDPKRRAVSASEWVAAHLSAPGTPTGHGFTREHAESSRLYFTFPIAPQVLGISIDTVNRGGYADGSVGRAQMAWLETQLQAVSSRWFDAAGTVVRKVDARDSLVVLFSHHNLRTMSNPSIDPLLPTDERVMGAEIEALLLRYPNVVAWINGHSHENRVYPHPDPSGRSGGFWEILTAAHVDYPQHARIIELADNRDGTLSIFATMVDHAGSARAVAGDASLLNLAAISRELSVNDPQLGVVAARGTPDDLNVELLVRAPFTLDRAPSTPAPAPAEGGQLPATTA